MPENALNISEEVKEVLSLMREIHSKVKDLAKKVEQLKAISKSEYNRNYFFTVREALSIFGEKLDINEMTSWSWGISNRFSANWIELFQDNTK